MTKTEKCAQYQDSLEFLRDLCPPGTKVYTILRRVAASGMTRWLDVVVMRDGEPYRITWHVAQLGIATYCRQREALKVGGCGQDAGFAVVYHLGAILYPDGFTCIGATCRSNDHFNGDRDRTPHHHASGGYALDHSWL